jgi:hypothetical protein
MKKIFWAVMMAGAALTVNAQPSSLFHGALLWDGTNVTGSFDGGFITLNNAGGITASGVVNATGGFVGSEFTGDGANLTGLNADNISSGTVPAGRLSTNGSALTNLYHGDGGSNNTWGSPSAMNPAFTTGMVEYAMGSPTAWALPGDNAHIYINKSTNFINNGGTGCAITGYGASGATVISLTTGPTAGYISTNETDGFINAAANTVFNYSATLLKTWEICSPGGGNVGASDSLNYAGLMWDVEHHVVGVPLVPTGNTNGGCNQPDSVVWDFTCTAPAVAPAFGSDGYIDSNGKVLTGYSNNAAKTHIFLTSSSAGNPVAAGTLTRISSPGTGDATITYSAVVANRGWIGWGFNVDQVTGNMGCNSNVISTNGHFQTRTLSTNYSLGNGVNLFGTLNGQGMAYMFGNLNNPDGMAEQQSQGAFSFQLGAGGLPFLSATAANTQINNGWFPSAKMSQVTLGGVELKEIGSQAQCDLEVHGSLGTMITNTAVNYTMTVDDSTLIVTATGKVVTLPDATVHCKYRIYTVKLTAVGTCTVTNGTGAQNIDGALSYTIPAQFGAVTVQSDGAQWWIKSKF